MLEQYGLLYLEGFIGLWTILTFIGGLRGCRPELSDVIAAAIWPITIISVFGLFVRGIYLTIREYV